MVACKFLLPLLVDASLNLLDAHEEFFSFARLIACPPAQLTGGPDQGSRHEFWRLGSLAWLGPRWREAAGFETPGLFEVLQQGFVFSAVDMLGRMRARKSHFDENSLAFGDVKNDDERHS